MKKEPNILDVVNNPKIKFESKDFSSLTRNLRQRDVLERIAKAVIETPYDKPLEV